MQLLELVMQSAQNLQFANDLANSTLILYLKNLAEYKKEESDEARGATLFGVNKRII